VLRLQHRGHLRCHFGWHGSLRCKLSSFLWFGELLLHLLVDDLDHQLLNMHVHVVFSLLHLHGHHVRHLLSQLVLHLLLDLLLELLLDLLLDLHPHGLNHLHTELLLALHLLLQLLLDLLLRHHAHPLMHPQKSFQTVLVVADHAFVSIFVG